MERHVTLVTQQLHVGILLPATHAAGAEATLSLGVSLAVLTLRPALPWIREQRMEHSHTHEQKLEDDLLAIPTSFAIIFTVCA